MNSNKNLTTLPDWTILPLADFLSGVLCPVVSTKTKKLSSSYHPVLVKKEKEKEGRIILRELLYTN